MSEPSQPQFLTRADGASIAYHKLEGKGGEKRPVGVIFLHGLISDMEGAKAMAVEDFCRRRGSPFIRFDTFGHGKSSGDFIEGSMSRWCEDAVAVLDELTEGPQVLVGSSMGGWLMLLAALQRPKRIAGLLGIAPAPDFTEDLMWDAMTPEEKRTLMEDGIVEQPNDYSDEPYRIARKLIEDGRKNLLLRGRIPLTCPVRILHGMADKDVPWPTAQRLIHALESQDVALTLVKGGGHSLSEPADLKRLERVLEGLLWQLEKA